MQLRRMDKALKVYKSVIKLNPKEREAYLKAANVLRDMERLPEVIHHLETAVNLDPSNPNAYGYLGEMLNNVKRWPEAVSWYERSLAIKPPPGTPRANKALQQAQPQSQQLAFNRNSKSKSN